MAEVTALHNLREHGYVDFHEDRRVHWSAVSDAKDSEEFRRQLREYHTQRLADAVSNWLISNPGIGYWDGTIRRVSVREMDYVQYRYSATVRSLNPFE